MGQGETAPGEKQPDSGAARTDEGEASSPEEALLAEALGFVVAGRPQRIEEGWLALAPPPFRDGVRMTHEVLTKLALCLPPEAPSAELRAHLIASVTRRMPKRAVVVIDMIHDHLDPGALLEVPRARDVVPALKGRLEEARAHGIPVVYVVDEHEADDPDLDAWGTHAVKGSPGTDVWAEIAPRSGDIVVKKPSYSAFFESDLGNVLDGLGVDTLVLTGCLTELGVLATATDALQRGFVIEVPPDAQAGSSAEAEQAALGILSIMAPFGPARKTRLERSSPLAA